MGSWLFKPILSVTWLALTCNTIVSANVNAYFTEVHVQETDWDMKAKTEIMAFTHIQCANACLKVASCKLMRLSNGICSMPVDENPTKSVKFYPSDGGHQTIPVYVRKGILNAGDDCLCFLFCFNCRAPGFQPLMFTGAIGTCRCRKQTGDTMAMFLFLTSSLPAGFCGDVGTNPRPPFRGS